MTALPPWTTLVSAATLAAQLSSPGARLMLLDVRFDLRDPASGRRAYEEGHLPGAVYLDLERDLSAAATGHNGRHPLPTREVFAARLSALGAKLDTQFVVYDAQGGMFAARAWWMLRWLGHVAVAVLDGGLPAWLAAGGALQQAAPAPQPAKGFPVREAQVPSIDHAGLRERLGQPGCCVVDARAPDRYRGENETLDPVGGHIPGAVNRFFQDNLSEGRFKAPDVLQQEWQAVLGGLAPQDLIHQCGSGVTACHNLLALAYAGLDGGCLYPGSWSEWCAQPDAPVARG